MSSKIKVDEDLPLQIAELLTTCGHDAKTVVEQGWRGLPDSDLWHRTQAEQRLLITGDKAFADLRRYPPGSHAGVILLRPQEESRRTYLRLMRAALEQLDLESNTGATMVVTEHGVRIRRAERH